MSSVRSRPRAPQDHRQRTSRGKKMSSVRSGPRAPDRGDRRRRSPDAAGDVGSLGSVEPTTERVASLPLVAAVALAAVAGFVDAVCFGHLFDVFPANQSGNIIFFGVAIGDQDASQLWPSATAMVG